MNRKDRITIETSRTKKLALDNTLAESGLSLPEWFDTQLAETTGELFPPPSDDGNCLTALSDLADPSKVLGSLGAIDWSFTQDPTGYLSHDIHPYPGKFIPQIARNLISRLSLPGETVCDPFGGSGTTALEATLLGRSALSVDVNPIAQVVGEAKTLTLTKEDDDLLCDLVDQLLILSAHAGRLSDELSRTKEESDHYIPAIPNLSKWFHDNAVRELAYLRWRTEQLSSRKARKLAKAMLSKSVLKASYQDSETRYASKPRPFPIGQVCRLFATNLAYGIKKLRLLGPRLRFREAVFRTLDFRAPSAVSLFDSSDSLLQNSVDLVVTSPPYANATDYHLYHRFRLFWLGFDPIDLAKKEIGSHLRHQKEAVGFETYLAEMEACLVNVFRLLRSGRYAVLVLSDSVFEGKIYHTPEAILKAAVHIGFENVGTITRKVHTTKRSFIAAARRTTSETLVVLRRPPHDVMLTLQRPPYKLWEYEDVLREREVKALVSCVPTKGNSGNLSVHVSPLALDHIRRLTFSHSFQGEDISSELTWQAILENGDTNTARVQRKDPKYGTHGLHAYKGKFYPQLAKSLFNLAALSPGQRILDPFCGSGTVLLEAYLNGFRGSGLDLNPLAVKIARIKTQILDLDPYFRDRLLARFQERLTRADMSRFDLVSFPEPIRRELQSWFPEPVLRKLAWLLRVIGDIPEPRVREFLEVIVSSIVRDVSHQEPKDLRIRRRLIPLRDAPVCEMVGERLTAMRTRLQHFSERAGRAPCSFYPAAAIEGDARCLHHFMENGVDHESVDAVVTSPPYATALPYIDTDRLSILLLFGLESKHRADIESALIGTREISKRVRTELEQSIDQVEWGAIPSKLAQSVVAEVRRRNRAAPVGFRRQNMAALLYMYFRDMAKVIANLDVVLRPNASAFVVIGDNRTAAGGKEVHIPSCRILQELGEQQGWRIVDVIPITVTQENRLHNKNSITRNEIIWFRKARH